MRDRRVWRSVLLVGLAAVVLAALFAAVRPPRAPLTEVYTPTYPTLPPGPPAGETLRFLIGQLQTPTGLHFLNAISPSESGAIWLAIVVASIVAFDFTRPRQPRHLDLLLMFLPGVLLFHSIGFFGTMRIPAYARLLDWVFWAVFLSNLALLARALWRATRPLAEAWQPGLSLRALMALALFLLSLDVLTALVRPPDDAGFFVNLGAQRLRERGRLPYGDPLLDGSAASAYGPLMYVAHVPFQWLIDPWVSNEASPDRPVLGERSTYLAPSALATQACTIAFHLVGVLALWIAARRMAGERVAWGVVALYCGSVAVLGVGGDVDQVMGISFVSHIAPTSAVLVALACLPSPWWAGVALATGAGLGFYPAFMAPAWVGHYWTDRRKLLQFLAGGAVAGALIAALVLLLSQAAPGKTLLGTFVYDTFGHHTDPAHYGHSPFGFWGQKGPVRTWLMQSLMAGSGFTSPAFLIFLAQAALTFLVTRRRPIAALALASAAVAIGSALLKIHPTGTYLAWSYPLLLLGYFAWPPDDEAPLH